MDAVRDGQDLHIVAHFRELVEKIAHRGNHAVGLGGIQIRSDQNFQFGILFGHIGLSSFTAILQTYYIRYFPKKLLSNPLIFL